MRFLPSAFCRNAGQIRRRDFIALVGGASVLGQIASAQQPALPVIGYLGSESPEPYASRLNAFREGLAE